MSSIVHELQREALDQNIRVSGLLRKATVVARKLGIRGEFDAWLTQELNGYDGKTPDYRVLTGQLRVWNPYGGGWQPVIFSDPEFLEFVSRLPCKQSVAEIESVIDSNSSGGTLIMHYPPKLEKQLMEGTSGDGGIGPPSPPVLHISRALLVGILDTARTAVLNWALKLEEDGIVGEGLAFTAQEKAVASTANYTSINNFFGTVGTSQIAQHARDPVQVAPASSSLDRESIVAFLVDLRQSLDRLGVDGEVHQEIAAEIRTVEAQLESPRPKSTIVRESLSSLRRILEGAAGGAGGQLALSLIPRLVALLS